VHRSKTAALRAVKEAKETASKTVAAADRQILKPYLKS
jgi:hypothetical protein